MVTLSNARLVLADEVMSGSVAIGEGRIAAIYSGASASDTDLEGDFLVPGLIDLHTDNLERQVQPRSTARWPSRSALMAHDAQCAAAGITTVFDALCLGDSGFEEGRVRTFEDGLADLRAMAGTGLLKAEHFLHLRCELPAPEMPALLDRAIDDPLVRLVSMMDHSPGFGQYADIGRYYRMRQADGFSEGEIQEMVGLMQRNRLAHHQPGRQLVLDLARERRIPLASHDDRTIEEVARNHADGIGISEFPVSIEAARAARQHGIRIIAGAANIVRGGSHSGNVAALDLVRAGLVDALASDYVPSAMMEAAFRCAEARVLSLPEAIGMISAGPAALAGLANRGRIAPGLRADLVRVRLHQGLPVIRAVWREGERVA
jgi:alpha-D-ribose 1-methylphosphonate 5-triphosphate diphosphatase